MSREADKTRTVGYGVTLEEGETVLRRTDVSDRQILRNLAIATGIVTAGLIAIQFTGGNIGWVKAVIGLLIFASVLALYSYVMERGSRWVLTDRRLIGPRGGSLPLSPDLKIRSYIWGIAVRQSMFKTLRIRSIEDKAGFADAIRRAIVEKATREIAE